MENPEKLSADEIDKMKEKIAEAMEQNFDTFYQLSKLVKLDRIHLNENFDDDIEDDLDSDSIEETEEEMLPSTKADELKTVELTDMEMENVEFGSAEDNDNLKLAWEVIELVKTAFINMVEELFGEKKTEAKTLFNETMMVLEEIGIENENYAQAIKDVGLCLKKIIEDLKSLGTLLK